ncbi:WD40-repeat-containing domain protein [Coprinopsis sp. MPI-PUGE-AT-0042]|nr:WD40-repeat-containing domain protein [Coprinopsis sp. MPI-PUGE-AT-0042]
MRFALFARWNPRCFWLSGRIHTSMGPVWRRGIDRCSGDTVAASGQWPTRRVEPMLSPAQVMNLSGCGICPLERPFGFSGATLRGSQPSLTPLTASMVVSGSGDKSIRVWDVSAGVAITVLRGHTSAVNALAYSPDGTQVVSGSSDKSARVWNLNTGEEVGVLKGHAGEIDGVAYSPDGTHIVTGSLDQSVRVWDISPNAYPPLHPRARSR